VNLARVESEHPREGIMNQPIHTMPTLEPGLPEIRERRCPYCKSERIAPVGHVTASAGMIRVQHRCEACETAFWFARKAMV
jgi:uncharacterized protein with PIN domain